MVKTEILGIDVDETKRETWVPIGAKYYLLLKKWWDILIFGLVGRGLMIGAQDSIWKTSHDKLKEIYPEITEIFSVDMEDCDLIWDITKPFEKFHLAFSDFDWIVCQSTLEHVVFPAEAIGNMSRILKKGGLLYIHTCGPGVEEHRYPVDCVRFMRDFFILCADGFNLKIEDLLWTKRYCYVMYRKQ